MRNPTPAPIVVPASGAPTCRGVALTIRDLADWAKEWDSGDPEDHVLFRARRAVVEGHVLCLRPTATRPACVGLAPAHFAVASMEPDFQARALVVDPYDADGADIRERPACGITCGCERCVAYWAGIAPLARQHGAVMAREDGCLSDREAHAVAVWEASEAV